MQVRSRSNLCPSPERTLRTPVVSASPGWRFGRAPRPVRSRRWHRPASPAIRALLAAVTFASVSLLDAAPAVPTAATAGFSLRWVTSTPVRVEVDGLQGAFLDALRGVDWPKERWQQLLAVRAEQGDLQADIGLPAMAGEYSLGPGTLKFVPQFPPAPGVRYVATFRPGALPHGASTTVEVLTSVFQAPRRPSGPPTLVSRIYPSAGTLPENQLKFYVHFSAPMSRGQIYDHIHLREETGKEVELPFLQIDEELWDPDLKRLTLLIDPGRIKRGVRPLEEVGPALVQGKRFRLQIDADWLDGNGRPLGAPFEKRFAVGPPDRTPPDPAKWKLHAPASGGRASLTVDFPDPMDHALALRMIQVVDAAGAPIAGTADLTDEERRWTFQPEASWRAGAYHLVVPTTIEDLAGNNIGKPFEVDLFEGVQRRITTPTVKLPFRVR